MTVDNLINDPVADFAVRLEAMTDDEVFAFMRALEMASEGTERADREENSLANSVDRSRDRTPVSRSATPPLSRMGEKPASLVMDCFADEQSTTKMHDANDVYGATDEQFRNDNRSQDHPKLG